VEGATVHAVAPSRARRRGTFSAFRRPFLTDPIFWIAAGIAVLIGVAVSGALIAFGGRMPDSVLSWGVAALFFVIAGWLSFKLLAMGLNTSRALEEAEPANETRAQKLEGTGRVAGATLGKGAARLVKGRSKGTPKAAPAAAAPAPAPASATSTPPPAPAPAPAAEEKPDVTVDKAARVLGSMVGKRLADRKKD
jgi:pyruvate/2-oxoglutarate dehydrogenase complex dihydrolipoamide acyltransferase (E2) component